MSPAALPRVALRWTPDGRRKGGRPKETGRTAEKEMTKQGWTWGYLERCAADRPRWRDLVAALRAFTREEDQVSTVVSDAQITNCPVVPLIHDARTGYVRQRIYACHQAQIDITYSDAQITNCPLLLLIHDARTGFAGQGINACQQT